MGMKSDEQWILAEDEVKHTGIKTTVTLVLERLGTVTVNVDKLVREINLLNPERIDLGDLSGCKRGTWIFKH